MLYIRFPLSRSIVEGLPLERGIEISHETVRYWWTRFGPMFAAEIRGKRVEAVRVFRQLRWHLDEVYVIINGVTHHLWWAVDHEGEVLESVVTKTRDRKAALKFIRKSMNRHGRPMTIVTDKFRSYGAALKHLGRGDDREMGRWLNNWAENSHLPFRRRERAMLRFRRMHTLQKVTAVHASVHNHFPTVRHPKDRNTDKTNRAAALVQWCGFLAAYPEGGVGLTETGSHSSDSTQEGGRDADHGVRCRDRPDLDHHPH
jgi:putative transposase